MEKATSSIQLSLTDEVLRKVAEIEAADELWKRLETLYMKKSLTNRFFLKQRLYTFKMEEGVSIDKQLDRFNEIIMELKNMEVEINDENQALILLCSLPSSYTHFVDTLIYGRDSISMEIVKSSLNSSEMRKRIME